MNEENGGNNSLKLVEGEKVTGLNSLAVKDKVSTLDELPIEQFPLYMNHLPKDAQDNVPLAALQALLYEGSPEEQALNFKNQGNECFQLGGPAGLEDAYKFYTKGLEAGCTNQELNALLYLNRAAANIGLEKWENAIKDAQKAIKLDEKLSIKANKRIIRAALPLQRAKEARISLEELKLAGIKMEAKIEEQIIILEQQAEEKQVRLRQAQLELDRVRSIVKDCGGVQVVPGAESAIMEYFGPSGAFTILPTVHKDQHGKQRMWPVLLLYPAAAQSDLLQSVEENSTLESLIALVFSEAPQWDTNHRYGNLQRVRVFWHDTLEPNRLVEVKKSHTLRQLIGTLIKTIERGILPFFVCPDDEDATILIKRFSKLESF